jgi:hypothetical protein
MQVQEATRGINLFLPAFETSSHALTTGVFFAQISGSFTIPFYILSLMVCQLLQVMKNISYARQESN